MPKKRYMLNPDISCRCDSAGVTLLDPYTGKSVAINAVGHLIWQALAQPCTQAEIVARLAETYQDAPADQVALDVAAFLQSLQPRGFIGEVLDETTPLPDVAVMDHQPLAENTLASVSSERESLYAYHGNSMAGTFRPGDYLAIEPVRVADVRHGDVVVYRGQKEAGESEEIVHRVVAITPDGLVTRGDNNPRVDDMPVSQEALLGRVTHVERAGRVHPVWGGRWGLLRLRALRFWRGARPAIARSGAPGRWGRARCSGAGRRYPRRRWPGRRPRARRRRV
jgi:signal peptidase I